MDRMTREKKEKNSPLKPDPGEEKGGVESRLSPPSQEGKEEASE